MIKISDQRLMKSQKTAESNGGGVWSLCANNSETKLAVGCEDGSLRIFSLIDGSLEYERALDRADGRVLSISWADNDLTLFAGCSDSSIRKYDVATGRITGRMTVDTVRSGGAREDTMVWAVKALKSGALVSGDSLGNVLIWDSKSCTLIQGIKAHKADVLCLVANEEGDRIYSSGIDRMIIQIGLVKDNAPTPSKKTKAAAKTANSSRWVVTGEKRYHSHDVRALALYNQRPHEVLVSGGVDTTLTLASPIRKFPHVSPRRLQPFPHRPLIAISRESRVLLARMGDDRLKLFKLGEPEESYKSDGESIEAPFDGQVIPRQSGWKHLLEIKVKAESNLICSTISHSGRFLACSDIASTKIYAISLTFKPKRVQLDLPPSNAMCFTPDSSKLIIGTLNSKIQVIDLASLQIIASFDEHKVATILDIKCSEDGQWCATGDCKGQIQVYNFGSLKHHATLPAFPQFTSLAFHSFSPSLVITTYENKFFVFDVVENRLTDWAKEYSDKLPYRFTNRKEKILGSCFPRRDEEEYRNNIWLWGAEMWCVADLDKVRPVVCSLVPLSADILTRRILLCLACWRPKIPAHSGWKAQTRRRSICCRCCRRHCCRELHRRGRPR